MAQASAEGHPPPEEDEPLPPLPKHSLAGPIVVALATLLLGGIGLGQATRTTGSQASQATRSPSLPAEAPPRPSSLPQCLCPYHHPGMLQPPPSSSASAAPTAQPAISRVQVPAAPARKSMPRAAPKEAPRPQPVASPTPGKVKMKDGLD